MSDVSRALEAIRPGAELCNCRKAYWDDCRRVACSAATHRATEVIATAYLQSRSEATPENHSPTAPFIPPERQK